MKYVTGFRRGIFCVLAVVLFLPGSGSGKSALQYTAEGDRYMLKGDYRKAVFSYRNALQKNQAHLKALIGIGNAWSRLDSGDAALRSFEKALKIDEKSVEALTGIGFILTHRGDSRRAIEYFNRAITISRESPAAHYGLAWLYYTMGKMIWARRRAESLLAVHPLHFDTLLLMADIIAREGDLKEAKKYAWKAIDAQPERTGGYLRLAAIMFRDYTLRGNGDSLDEASKAVDNALVINADSPDANMLRGLMLWYEKKYADAAAAFEKALGQKNSVELYYSLAITRDSLGAADAALKNFLEAMKLDPVDPILRSRFEQFMVVRDIKAGHPARAMFFRESLEAGKKRMKQNLPDEAVLYLRRTLLLNPMSREARELLMGYYEALSYNRFYIRELKEMQRLYPGTNSRDRLTAAVYRRRSRMYHREGFSGDDLPRDVPRILVLDFHSEEGVGPHPDLGAVSAFDLTWALAQFGRQEPVPVRARLKAAGLKMTPAGFAGTMDHLEEMTKKKAIAPFDYLLYGSCREEGATVALSVKLLDFRTGVIVGEFSMKEKGRDAMARLVLRTARRIYGMVPFYGRVLKQNEDSIIVNLGLFDGVRKNDKFVITRIGDASGRKRVTRRMVFTVSEVDTLVAKALPARSEDLQLITSRDRVEVLKKRRARLIEE